MKPKKKPLPKMPDHLYSTQKDMDDWYIENSNAQGHNSALDQYETWLGSEECKGEIKQKVYPFVKTLFKWECIPSNYNIEHECRSITQAITTAISKRLSREEK